MPYLSASLRRVAALAAGALALQAAAPAGWVFNGKSQEYDCSIDASAPYNGQPSTYIRSRVEARPTSSASVWRDFDATPYAGKRIRLSAALKADGVKELGSVWMRVDDAKHPKSGYPASVALDNGVIKGTTGWRNYSIVLDVPPGATGIYIGFLLAGTGAVWMNGDRVEVVGPEVPVTARSLGPRPKLNLTPENLDFR
jgi:hypothetical protein